MKTKSILVGLFMLLSLVSCKKETDKKEGNQKLAELKETFDVNFNLVVEKDDTFQLYYTEDGTLNFSDDKSIKSELKGSVDAQDVLFKLPADVLPTNIRLDFGDNPEQGSVVVNSLKLKYLNNEFNVTKDLVTQYFYLLNEQVKYDAAKSSIIILSKPGVSYDPLMWGNESLSREMIKLAEAKETFDVNFNLLIEKDDTFQLYYTEDGTLNFSDDKSIKSVVKGNTNAQDVLFKLPADVLPSNIRLDFGSNPEQGSVVVNSMKLKYLNNEFIATKDLVTQYFYLLNEQVKYDPAKSSIIMFSKAGNVYDPLMWSNQLLSEEMIKLYKNN
jgi:hypothetical protein